MGELLYYISIFSSSSLRFLVFYFEVLLFGLFLYLTYNFFYKQKLNFILLFIFFSPVFLIYPLVENEILVRKEFLFFIFYIVYLNKLIKNQNIYIYLSVSLPLINLVWDGIIFYLFFLFFSFIVKKNLKKNELIKFFISFIPYLICLFFVINAKSNDLGLSQICISIKEDCFGAMLALDKNLLWNINYQISRFELIYLIKYIILIIVIFFPCILISYYEKNYLMILKYNISKKFILISLNFITITCILIFMLIGFDWGRWINIGYVMLVFTLFYFIKINFVNIKKNDIVQKMDIFFDKNKKISLTVFYFYIMLWHMKATMTDDIGSLPYLRILDKFFDYL